VTTSAERRVRGWLAVAAVLAQLAAAGAGLMSGATLVLVAGASGASPWVVAKPSARSTRVGYVLAAAVAMNAVRELLARPTAVTHAGISASLSTLTLTLVLLMVVLAPTWRRPRDHRLWLAMSAAVAVAACATGSGRAEAFVLVVSWLVLLIAAGVVQVSSLSATADVVAETDALPKAQRPIALLRFASVAMPVGVGVLIFALLPGGLGGGALPTKLAHFVNAPAGYVPTRGQLGVDTMGNGELDLRARGALPTTPLLLVPPDAPPLWRGSVYRDYSGQDWRAAAPDDSTIHRLVRGTDVTLPRAEEDPLPTGVTRTDVVRLEPSTHALLAWAPGVIQRVQADMFGAVRDGGAVRIFGSRAASGYTVTSDVASTAPWLLRRASGADNVDSSWTALPGELPQRVTDLAHRVTAAAPTRFEQVQAIQAYLRTHETYALNSPVPGPGEDAVDRFLFRNSPRRKPSCCAPLESPLASSAGSPTGTLNRAECSSPPATHMRGWRSTTRALVGHLPTRPQVFDSPRAPSIGAAYWPHFDDRWAMRRYQPPPERSCSSRSPLSCSDDVGRCVDPPLRHRY
jgi:protein-glutamine gamma-glutamyltransferase